MTRSDLVDLVVASDTAPERDRLLIAGLVLTGCGDVALAFRKGAIARTLSDLSRVPTDERILQ